MTSENVERGSAWRFNRWRTIGWGTAAIMLLLPLVAMQFTDEVDWNAFDFITFGAILAMVGGVFELVVRMTPNSAYRGAVALALAAAFILVWVNLAVGIIGNEENPANLMYFGVLAVGIIGAIVVRRRPGGMLRVMVAMAIAQALVAVVVLLAGLGNTLAVTTFFIAMWLTSAWLFGKAEVSDEN